MRKAREKIGKTQQLVATEAGMSVAGYRKLEAGGVRRPAATTIHGISRSVGMAAHEIDEFAEVLAGYEVGTQVAYQTVALAEPQVAVPDVEETRLRYRAGEFEGDVREDEALRAEIEALVERQRWLSREQKDVAEKLAVFAERQPTAQDKAENEEK